MNRPFYIISAVTLAIVLAIGAGIWVFLGPSTVPSPDTSNNTKDQSSSQYVPYPQSSATQSAVQNTPKAEAVRAAYQAALTLDNPDTIQVGKTAVSGSYALQAWAGSRTGGQALLKFDASQNAWVIVDPGGGAWSLDGLVSAGVPEDNAAVLIVRIR
jgi:hypothetical protein